VRGQLPDGQYSQTLRVVVNALQELNNTVELVDGAVKMAKLQAQEEQQK